MSERVSRILEDARELSPVERAALIDDLLGSLDEPDEHVDQLWQAEAEDRLAAYRRGEPQVVDADQVLGHSG